LATYKCENRKNEQQIAFRKTRFIYNFAAETIANAECPLVKRGCCLS